MSTKKLQILGSLGSENSIKYTEQSLTEEQKAQARNNIGVQEDVADALLSLELVKPIGDEDAPLTENNETFLVVRNEDIFLPEVSAEDEGNILKVVDGKWTNGVIDIPETQDQIQVDWNQNDETSVDYIKNRTHYIDGVIINNKYPNGILEDLVSEGPDEHIYKISNDVFDIQNGFYGTIVANINGVDCTFNINGEDSLEGPNGSKFYITECNESCLGLRIRYDQGPRICTGEFLIVISDSYEYTNHSATWTLSRGIWVTNDIIKSVSVINSITQLDEKFIPDTIARKSDITWDNLPYNLVTKDFTEEIIVDGLTYEDYNNGRKPACNFIPNEIYKVIWNGEVYDNLVCSNSTGWNVIMPSGEGYPGYIDDDGGDDLYINPADYRDEWVVTIIKKKVVYVFDEDCIPNTIARKVDLVDPTWDSISNKPFLGGNILVDNITNEDLENGNIPACNFVVGESYNVIFNDKLYEDVICYKSEEGPWNVLGGTLEYPFYIDDDGGNALVVGADEPFTLSITSSTKIKPNCLPDGGFGWEEDNNFTIEWDGNIEGKESFEGIAYKVSDLTPSVEDVIGATVETNTGETLVVEESMIDAPLDGLIAIGAGEVAIIDLSDEARVEIEATGMQLPSNGIYFVSQGGMFISSLSYGDIVVHKIDEKFIPDAIARKNDVPLPEFAQVGQTIVVKSVDENGKPTEWEAVDPWVMTSTTEGSTKKFKLSIGDDGVLTATEIEAVV